MNQPTNGQLPLMTLLKKPSRVADDILVSFGDEEKGAVHAAIVWAWQQRRVKQMSQAHAAQLLDVRSSHLCNILQGKKYLPLHKLNSFEQLVGNTAVTQTVARFATLREDGLRQQIGELVAEHMVSGGRG